MTKPLEPACKIYLKKGFNSENKSDVSVINLCQNITFHGLDGSQIPVDTERFELEFYHQRSAIRSYNKGKHFNPLMSGGNRKVTHT